MTSSAACLPSSPELSPRMFSMILHTKQRLSCIVPLLSTGMQHLGRGNCKHVTGKAIVASCTAMYSIPQLQNTFAGKSCNVVEHGLFTDCACGSPHEQNLYRRGVTQMLTAAYLPFGPVVGTSSIAPTLATVQSDMHCDMQCSMHVLYHC